MKYIKLRPDVKDLKQKHNTDVGYDLYWYPPENKYNLDKTKKEWYLLSSKKKHKFETGISLSLPKTVMGLILDKSGIALKHGLHVLGGVIDPGYIGEINIILYNTGKNLIIKKGSPLAQLVFIPVMTPKMRQSKVFKNTKRGESGFNSKIK